MNFSETLYQARVQLWDLTYLHSSWFGIIAMLVIVYIILIKVIDKSRLIEI
jgi:hypothetical protein